MFIAEVRTLIALMITLIATSAFCQNYPSEEIAARTLNRRVVEAVNWGIPVVDFDRMDAPLRCPDIGAERLL
jgi:hypothetical protein